MSELISTAPLYAKARVHLTKIGNILCTGRGCIGCDRKNQNGEQEFLEILGDVDSVDFNKQEPRFLSSPGGIPYNHGVKNNRRHGNAVSSLAKNKKGKLCRVSLAAKEQNLSSNNAPAKGSDFPSLKKKIKRADLIVIHDNKDAKTRSPGGSVKTAAQSKLKTQVKNKTVSFATPLVRQGTFTIEEETAKSGKSQEENKVKKSKQVTATLQSRRFHARSKTYPLHVEPKTNFLKMLHNSSVGIFDIESMQNKKSSKWVEEALKSGVKQEELFPQIHNDINESKHKNTSRNFREEDTARRSKSSKAKKFSKMSSKDRFDSVDGSSSVFVIEHSHEKTNAKDESLHKLGFRVQWGERIKSFPDFSILEIAESLDGFVQLGAIKLISQEHAGRWCILVSSRIIRDYLVQSGVTLRGRRFELHDSVY
ncbi:hypothetical protein ACROYT_G002745 [Oculina patagonica]